MRTILISVAAGLVVCGSGCGPTGSGYGYDYDYGYGYYDSYEPNEPAERQTSTQTTGTDAAATGTGATNASGQTSPSTTTTTQRVTCPTQAPMLGHSFSENGVATFSWNAVEHAQQYRIVVTPVEFPTMILSEHMTETLGTRIYEPAGYPRFSVWVQTVHWDCGFGTFTRVDVDSESYRPTSSNSGGSGSSSGGGTRVPSGSPSSGGTSSSGGGSSGSTGGTSSNGGSPSSAGGSEHSRRALKFRLSDGSHCRTVRTADVLSWDSLYVDTGSRSLWIENTCARLLQGTYVDAEGNCYYNDQWFAKIREARNSSGDLSLWLLDANENILRFHRNSDGGFRYESTNHRPATTVYTHNCKLDCCDEITVCD